MEVVHCFDLVVVVVLVVLEVVSFQQIKKLILRLVLVVLGVQVEELVLLELKAETL